MSKKGDGIANPYVSPETIAAAKEKATLEADRKEFAKTAADLRGFLENNKDVVLGEPPITPSAEKGNPAKF
jgi:hypothetical protein